MLRVTFSDYTSSYYEDLLSRAGLVKLKWHSFIVLQSRFLRQNMALYQPIQQSSLSHIYIDTTLGQKNHLKVPGVTATTYGLHSLKYLGSKIWNDLDLHIKEATSLDKFKAILVQNRMGGLKCKFALCRGQINGYICSVKYEMVNKSHSCQTLLLFKQSATDFSVIDQ